MLAAKAGRLLLLACVLLCVAPSSSQDEKQQRKFPKGLSIYCGERNCYDVLEVEETATDRDIKKGYRRLSLANHPDKSDRRDAPERFMAIATAYEVLSNEKMRKAYDDFLAHPERHVWQHYSAYYQAYYAPKSDLRLVLLGILVVCTAIQYASISHTKHRFSTHILEQQATKNLVNKKVYELAGRQLNLKKEKDYQEFKRHEKVAQKEILKNTMVGSNNLGEDINPRDLLIFWVMESPLRTLKWGYFQVRWVYKFNIMGHEYGEEEKAILTRKALTIVFRADVWQGYDDETKQETMDKELWLPGRTEAFRKEMREDYFASKRR